MGEYHITKHEKGILEWTINRPSKRNAINENVMNGLKEALIEAENNPNIKALVISSTGECAFCSGGDLKEFQNLKTEEEAYPMLSKMGLLLYQLTTLPIPTLALLNGPAVGGGCEIATACDFRISKAGCMHGFIQGSLAITTGWGGASLLYEKLPSTIALKMLLESIRYDAEYLKQLGFIHEVYQNVDIEHAKAFLSMLLETHETVLRAYKNALVTKWIQTNLRERMLDEIKQCSILWSKEEHHQAVRKFLGK